MSLSESPDAGAPAYYRRHVFFCLNQREMGEACCQAVGAQRAFEHCRQRVKAAGQHGEGRIRVNKAGCLDRCGEGPVMVVYPEAVWYTYVDLSDIDEIVQSHLLGDVVVERLRLPNSSLP